jgi:hypothetical protein
MWQSAQKSVLRDHIRASSNKGKFVSNSKSVRVFASFAFLLGISAPLVSAWAHPVTYTFTTASNPSGKQVIAAQLGSTASMSGSFTYDYTAPATDSMLNYGYGSATIYGRPGISFSNFSGTVGSYNFSDPFGFAVVGNNMSDYAGASPGQDWLGLIADPTAAGRPNDLSGFVVGDYTLVNIRMFWFSGLQGATDFLSSNSMPSSLPSIFGTVGLDFIPTGVNPESVNATLANAVFFDAFAVEAVPVSPIPEPETYVMLLAGLGLLGFHTRRRKLKEVAAA